MKKNIIRIITITLLVALFCYTLTNIIYAADVSPTDITKGDDPTQTKDSVLKILQAIFTITQVIGVGVAVIMLVVLAIKYIAAAPSDKAEIKKHAVVYVVGAIVLFASSGILEIIKRFAGMVKPADVE